MNFEFSCIVVYPDIESEIEVNTGGLNQRNPATISGTFA